MIQCPECRSMIPDDSAFCDQCGKELKWCPECKRPKRGTECPLCGSDLIPGRKYLAGDLPKASQPADSPSTNTSGSSSTEHQRTVAEAAALPFRLAGNGWALPFHPGTFGRTGGIWPELSSCQYVSGRHGDISSVPGGWAITDLGSTNGTFLNGQRIDPMRPYPLKKGDRVRIATLDFTVE